MTFAVHGAAAAIASAIASGLVALSVLVFTASPGPVTEARVPAAAWVLLAAIGMGLVAFGEPPHGPRRRRLSVSRLVYWGLLVIGLGAVVTRALSPSIATGRRRTRTWARFAPSCSPPS